MTPCRRPRLLCAVLGGAGASALVLACAQDWAVRDAGDGGALPGEAGADVRIEGDAVGADARLPADAGSDVDASAADCDALRAEVEAKRKAARRCVLASGQCTEIVKDQCDCDVVIAIPGSAAVATYEAAVTAFESSGCARGCAQTCAATTPRNCLQNGADVLCVP